MLIIQYLKMKISANNYYNKKDKLFEDLLYLGKSRPNVRIEEIEIPKEKGAISAQHA